MDAFFGMKSLAGFLKFSTIYHKLGWNDHHFMPAVLSDKFIGLSNGVLFDFMLEIILELVNSFSVKFQITCTELILFQVLS